MQPNSPMRQVPDSDFNFMDLLRAIVRQRLWFLAGLVGCLVAGGAYLVFKSPVYEARVKVRIGQVAEDGPFEAADVLALRLVAEHGEILANGVRRPRPYLTRAAVEKGNAPVVELTAEGDSPDVAADFLTRVFSDLSKRHGGIYEHNVGPLKERILAIDQQRSALQAQFAEASSLADRLRQANPVEAALVALEVSAIAEAITSIDKDRPEWARELAPPKTEPTELLGEIRPPAKPSSPKPGLALALACFAGLIVGLLFVFIAEVAARLRGAAVDA